MNILLTSVGRRSHWIEAFKEAVGDEGEVYACDARADAPALQSAHRAFLVPPIQDCEYVGALLKICLDHGVGLLIPALEPELPIVAAHQKLFATVGTTCLVSTPEVTATCYDKLATAEFLRSCEFEVPRTYLSVEAARTAVSAGEVAFPLIVKPRWGVSSIGTGCAEDEEELECLYKLTKKQLGRTFLATINATDPERCLLIQERLAGVEYGLDVINDLDGRYVATLARRKDRLRGGQADRIVTVVDERLEKLGAIIGRRLGHCGMLDCDVFLQGEKPCVIDLNPRIGGGYPFSHHAGANFPAALIAWAKGREPNAACFNVVPGLTVARCDGFVVSNPHAREVRRELPSLSSVSAGCSFVNLRVDAECVR